MIGQDSMSYQRLATRQPSNNYWHASPTRNTQSYSQHASRVPSNMSAPLWQFRAQPSDYEAPNNFATHQAPRTGFGETYSTAMADMHRSTTNFVNQAYAQRGYDDRVHAGIYVDPNTKEVFDLWEESMPERQRDESLNPDAHAMDRMFHQATGNTFAPDFQDHLDPNANDPDALDHMGYRSFKPEENNMDPTFSRYDRYQAETGYGHAHAVGTHVCCQRGWSQSGEQLGGHRRARRWSKHALWLPQLALHDAQLLWLHRPSGRRRRQRAPAHGQLGSRPPERHAKTFHQDASRLARSTWPLVMGRWAGRLATKHSCTSTRQPIRDTQSRTLRDAHNLLAPRHDPCFCARRVSQQHPIVLAQPCSAHSGDQPPTHDPQTTTRYTRRPLDALVNHHQPFQHGRAVPSLGLP